MKCLSNQKAGQTQQMERDTTKFVCQMEFPAALESLLFQLPAFR